MKSDNPNIQSLIKTPVMDVISSYEPITNMYVCGGYLRNILLKGDAGKDIDVFVDSNPKELKSFIKYLQGYGRVDFGQYGSPRFYPDTIPGTYVDLVPFYNFTVAPEPITNIHDLLCSFDFTANAIGINIKTGEFHDPVNGVLDITHKILRAVRLDFPERPVSDDIALSAVSVFWFRLLHYQHTLGFTFTPETEQWILANAFRHSDLEDFTKYFFEPQMDTTIKEKIKRCLQQKIQSNNS